MAARIRIPLRERRPNRLAMQRTLMNNYFDILPFSFSYSSGYFAMLLLQQLLVAAAEFTTLKSSDAYFDLSRPNQIYLIYLLIYELVAHQGCPHFMKSTALLRIL